MKRGPRAGGLKKSNRGWRPRRSEDPRALVKMNGLTPRQRVFVTEYLRDFNQTRAALAAGCPAPSASSYGSDLIRDHKVLSVIHQELVARRERAEVSADEVATYWYDLATADARELTPIRIGPCRYCWGMDNQYQFTQAELRRLRQKHLADQMKLAPHKRRELDELGGDGYDVTADPSPECPECHGLGINVPVPLDLSRLSRGATLLYDGVKLGRSGQVTEIKMRDRSRAMENLAAVLGITEANRRPDLFVAPQAATEEQLDRMLEHLEESGLITREDIARTIDGEFEEVGADE